MRRGEEGRKEDRYLDTVDSDLLLVHHDRINIPA
jgi:hypothetical protein